jgi:vacuolar-type H+-ATPase subunit I/STV1
MKNLIVVLSLFLFFTVSTVKAQTQTPTTTTSMAGIIDVPTKLFNWIKSFNKEASNFFSAAKCEKLKRELGYIKTDLEEYLSLREALADTLEKNNYKYNFTNRTKTRLISTWTGMSDKLKSIRPELSGPLEAETDKLIETIQSLMHNKQRTFVSKIDKMIAFNNVEKAEFKTSSEKSLKDLKASIDLITQAQTKLEQKAAELGNR